MDTSTQVLKRSAKMGMSYVVLSLVMMIFISISFGIASRAGSVVTSGGRSIDVGSFVFMVIPFAAIFGLIITTPVYLLFVNDKNAGVVEYLLAVGMSQRDVFRGYLKAALLLSLAVALPAVAINSLLSVRGPEVSGLAGALAVMTDLADVALVTFLMIAFSSMQRKPTGMNSPLGISIGIFLVLPEFVLLLLLGAQIIWLDLAIALAMLGTVAFLLISVDSLIVREKLLP